MEIDEVIYGFVDQIAYFSCAANIVMENYTLTDGEENYRRLILFFRDYLSYYNNLKDLVQKQKITKEIAEVKLKSYLAWFRQKTIKKFTEKMQECLNSYFPDEECIYDIGKALDLIQQGKRFIEFKSQHMIELMENVRKAEEKPGGGE